MHIVHYMSRFRLEDGGVVRAVLDICTVLAQRGHNVDIITWDATDIPDAWKQTPTSDVPRVHQIDAPARIGGFFTGAQRAHLRTLLDGAEVLHLHTPWDRSNLQLARLARSMNLPYVVTVHGMLDDWSMAQKTLKKRTYLALGARAMLEHAYAVHCTAQGELDQAKRWFPRGRGVVVPLLFDLEPFRSLPGGEQAARALAEANTDVPIVLFLSRLHHKKRPEALIDAAGALCERGHRGAFRVLIAGSGEPGYEASLRERIAQRGLDEVVALVGLVTGEVKISLFQRARVFVLPTSQENFGFVLTESLACGTPVVTTRGTDIWPELEASGGAMIVEGDATSLADAIEVLLDDASRSHTMGEAGRRWVFSALDPATIAEAFESMYDMP